MVDTGRPRIEVLKELYSSRCAVCGGRNTSPLGAGGNGDDWTAIINGIARQLFDKKLETGSIPREMYEKTADTLMQGVFGGLGGKAFGYDDPNNKLVMYLRQNVHAFSAAKSLVEMQTFNDLLIDKDGKVKPFKQFRDDVAKTGAVFNKTHLQVEHDTAIARSQTAQFWNETPDDEILEILTAGDSHVRPEHAILDHFTAYKTDPVWLRLCPPFDHNCRCKLSHGLISNIRPFKTSELLKQAKVPEYFQTNAGITKTVFDKDYPHFHDAFGRERELAAEHNYNMPSVKKLYNDNNFPAAKKLQTKEEANDWWKEKTGGDLRGSFDIVDKLGTAIRFDNDTRKHIMEDNKDQRHAIMPNIEHITTDPDEVWSIRENNKLTTTYIKYYEDYPYAVQVDGTRAYTAFQYQKKGKLNEQSIIMDRRGILLFRKN